MSPPARVLLVEPWFAGSHRAWAEGIRDHSRHRIELLTRPPAGWRSTFEQSAAELAARAGPPPDLVIASSMMDVAQFRVRSGFPQVPTVLYMHENQLTYDRSRPDLARGAINWRSVESADRVVFNSQFHRDDFFGAAPQLGVTAIAADRAHGISLVLPVGIEPFFRLPARRVGGPPVVLWNHRWEADKDPDAFVEALMQSTDLELRLVLAGEGRPPARLLDSFGPRVLHAGFAPEATYRKLLQRSDIVVSTARQEFFGVSVAEAMAGGAVPLVPNRLAYPELLGPDLAACLYEPGTLAARLRSWVTDRGVIEALRPTAQQAGRRFDWRKVAPRYDVLIDEMA